MWLQILRDPSGNSFVENVCAPATDPQREVTSFARTRDEDHALGIYTQEEIRQREMEGEDGVRKYRKLQWPGQELAVQRTVIGFS